MSKQIVNDELIVSYMMDSTPANSAYGVTGIYIEFFKADASGEGEKFLGSTFYTLADFNGGNPLVRTVNLGNINTLGISANDPVTATATDANGNTSEFTPTLGPTAAEVTVSGQVFTADGNGIGKTRVTLSEPGGLQKTALTNNFGHYKFENVEVGKNYVLAVSHKKYQFAQPVRLLTVLGELSDVNFIAIP